MSPAARRLACFLSLVGLTFAAGPATPPPGPPPTEESVELPKFSVKSSPVCSFGLALSAIRDPATKRIKRLFITAVSPESDADGLGLHAGDEIITINGHKVEGMDGTVKPGAQLFDLMVSQPAGKTVQLEVVVRSTRRLTLKATEL